MFRDQEIRTAVAPDKDPERAFLPDPRDLKGKLLLADRGYWDLEYFMKVDQAGGFFLIRGKTDFNPTVLRVRGPRGCDRRFQGRPLQAILGRLPRRRLDLMVAWNRPGGRVIRLRLVLAWRRHAQEYLILGTNVPRSVLRAHQIERMYHLRWQLELLLKEWKSYANLPEFASSNRFLVEGLIWASLCAAALKRSLAHARQRTGPDAAISTRIVSMCGPQVLPELVRSVLNRFRHLETVLDRILRYLWDNAQRAHPKRDRTRGRMQFGLEHVGFES